MSERSDLARAARRALGMTQAEFASLLGVPRPTVGRWEAGMRDPGAVGECLLALVIADPEQAQQTLRKLPRAI